jgi:hypothetical protein
MPVPLGPIHRRLWRTFWRRCSCGLPAPCIERRIPAPVPLPNRTDVSAKLPDLHTADHDAWGAGAHDAVARPAPALGHGLRVSAAGRTAARQRRDAMLTTQEYPSLNGSVRGPRIAPGSTPRQATAPAGRRSASVPTSRRARRRPTPAPAWAVLAERSARPRGSAGLSALILQAGAPDRPGEATATVESRPPAGGQAGAATALLRQRPSATGEHTHTARSTATRQIAAAGATMRRTHARSPGSGGWPRGWGSEIGRAGALTPAQHHRTGGGVRDGGRGAE